MSNYNKDEHSVNNSHLFKQIEKLNLFFNRNIIYELKKMNHTSFSSKNNSKKNSIVKNNNLRINNANPFKFAVNNRFSTTLKLSNYNKIFNNKNFESKPFTSELIFF